MRHILRYLLLMTVAAACGCSNFLNEHTSSRGYVRSISDINELILGEGYLESYYTADGPASMQGLSANRALPGWIHVMDDDSEVNNNSPANYVWVNAFGPAHAWQMNPFINPISEVEESDPTWSRLYKHINAMNAILVELDEKFAGVEGYGRSRGEALFLRAFYYFYLVNFYALPYDKSTGGADPGVPLKTSGKVEDKNWERATVGTVYGQIIKDLQDAVTLLDGAEYYYESDGTPRPTIYRPSQAAARHLLARACLFTCDWDGCIEQCTEILKGGYALRDYRPLGARESKLTADSPEIIFSNGEYRVNSIFYAGSGNSGSTGACFRVSEELISIYDQQNDKRFEYFEWTRCTYAGKTDFKGYYPTMKLLRSGGLLSDAGTFRLAEVYLNMAEAYALKGGADGEARAKINELRRMRFVEGSTYEVPASTAGGELVELVREERRRELCFEGHRWFDLRRYAVCPVHPMDKEIRHIYQDNNPRDGVAQGYYILPRFSEDNSNWVMPIPASEITINHGALTQNVRRTPVKHEGMDGFQY